MGGGALALLASLALMSLKVGEQRRPATGAPLGLREPQNPDEERELQDKAT